MNEWQKKMVREGWDPTHVRPVAAPHAESALVASATRTATSILRSIRSNISRVATVGAVVALAGLSAWLFRYSVAPAPNSSAAVFVLDRWTGEITLQPPHAVVSGAPERRQVPKRDEYSPLR